MTRDELLEQYTAGERDFQKANLREANLYGYNASVFPEVETPLEDSFLRWNDGSALLWSRLDGPQDLELHRVE